MKKTVMNDGFGNFLVYFTSVKNEADLEEKMLLNNQIEGLLPVQMQIVDQKKGYYYTIDGCQKLVDFFGKKTITGIDLRRILTSIFETLAILKKYLLKADHVLLYPDDIYIKNESLAVKLCYLPGTKEECTMIQLKALVEFFMNRIDHKEEQTVVFLYGLYRIVGEENCSLSVVQDYLTRAEKKKSREKSWEYKQENTKTKPEQTVLEKTIAIEEASDEIPKKSSYTAVLAVHLSVGLLLAAISAYFLVRFILSDGDLYLLRNFIGICVLVIVDFISLSLFLKKRV